MSLDPRDAPLRLLDGVRWHGRELPGDRAAALLAALALAAGRAVPETRLVDDVWGDEPPARPAKALQVLVSRTRAATDPDLIVRTDHGYRLGEPSAVDAVRLQRGLTEAREAEAAGRPARTRAATEPLLVLAVTSAQGADPLGRLREEAARSVEDARAICGRSLLALGDHAAALPLLETAVSGRPDDEPLLVALLRAEAATRGIGPALTRYEAHRARLRGRLGTDPSPELRALHAELLARDRPVREGLSFDVAGLVGRDDDVTAVTALAQGSRLTSVVGPGGLGKTRLVNAVGRMADQPVVQLVELAGVTTPEGVGAEVASVLGVRDSLTTTRLVGPAHRADLVQRLVDQVGSVPTLLILDNCEHLLDAVADLVGILLARTPRLHVLTTSRSPLGLAAEQVYLLPQLSTDDAARLFEQRARAARSDVRLDPEQVRRLVDRLDGLPLAVELAAAKVRVMSVTEVERRLDDRFALLRGGSRHAPARHRTLLAVIDWSWALLADDQRAVLRRLAVFRDGFSLTGAEAVAVDARRPGPPDAVLDHVTALVEQSLVVVHEGERVRYRLLETVREFARDRLADAGEGEATETQLRRWADGLAAEGFAGIHGADQVAVMSAMHEEEGNLLDVLGRAWGRAAEGSAEDAGLAAALVATLSAYWTIRGDHLRVLGLLDEVEEVLAVAQVAPEREDALRAALAAVMMTASFFSPHSSPRALERLTALGPGGGHPQVRAQVRLLLALVGSSLAEDPGRLDDLCRDPEPVTRRLALQWAAQAYENSGEIDRAVDAGERALAVAVPGEGPWTRALLLAQLAGLAAHRGDYAAGRAYAETAEDDMRRLGAVDDFAQLSGLRVIAAVVAGRLEEAELLLAELTDRDELSSLFGGALIAQFARAELQLARGQVAEGLATCRQGVSALAERSVPRLSPELSEGLEPWVLYPSAAAVAAHARHGDRPEVAALVTDLAAKAVTAVAADRTTFVDYPVVASVAAALVLWVLYDPNAPDSQVDAAVELLAAAELCGANQTIPSLRLGPAEELADRRRPGRLATARAALAGRRAVTLRPDLARLLAAMGTPSAQTLRE